MVPRAWVALCSVSLLFPCIGAGPQATPHGVLAFAELEPLARAGHTVLLSLLDALIAREEAGLLEAGAQFDVEDAQRARDAEPHRACLTGDAAAIRGHDHVELIGGLGEEQRMPHDRAQRFD